MIVTKIESLGKSRYRIYLEEQPAFVLYKGELSRYGLEEGEELSEEAWSELMGEVLPKRAKLRSMNLLKTMDRTEWQLRKKLNDGGYPQEIIEEAVSYVTKYGYINDESFAQRYIEFRKETKSRMQLTQELLQKGISKEIIQKVFEERDPLDEAAMIRKWIRKKRIDPNQADPKEKQKLYASLMRRGFSGGEVRRVMESWQEAESGK